MQPVNISTSDTLQYPLSVCRYKIVFNYQELTNIHDVLLAFAILFDRPCAYILTVIVFVLLWRMCQEQPKSDSSYNSTIIQLLANCFHSFIHMIDIFCLGASLVSFAVFSVFNFLHIGKVERGKVLSTHYKRQNMLTYPYCIYDIYIHWHMIFSIYSNLWLSVNFYGLSLYIYIQYKTTVSSEAFIL